MNTLTAPLKKQITSDWRTKFEDFGIYQSMWLGRVVGPLFQGICLERSSGNSSYLPTTHIHCLCRDFPVVSLTLAQRLLSSRSGSEERITVQFHEARFAEAAQRLRDASLLPLSGTWELRDLIASVEPFRKIGLSDAKYPVALFESVVLTAGWLGQIDQANSLLAKYEACAADWPDNILARCGGYRMWANSLRELVENQIELKRITECHAEKLKVAQLPRVEMPS